MYTLDGAPVPDEWEDPELEGYRGSAPVRWGNGAADQRQHDVYGEVPDGADQWVRAGGRFDSVLWGGLSRIADDAARAWREPDQGIWEVRGPGRIFTYSAGMCLVALDRAASLGDRLGLTAMEPPISLDARDLRDRKVDVLRSIRPLSDGDILRHARRGRYTGGLIGGVAVPAYVDEDGVDPAHGTETFAELELRLDNWRWHETTFRLRTGKALGRDRKEVAVHFRPVPLLPRGMGGDPKPNVRA